MEMFNELVARVVKALQEQVDEAKEQSYQMLLAGGDGLAKDLAIHAETYETAIRIVQIQAKKLKELDE